MTEHEFAIKYGFHSTYYLRQSDDHLPCFAHRWSVNDNIKTEKAITEYIQVATDNDDNDVIVFSVTENDKGWNAWKAYAKKYPRKFKVVEGGSIHGKYLCRMYIYTKPPKKRKFHPDNIKAFKPR
jgi:hypothetical protein